MFEFFGIKSDAAAASITISNFFFSSFLTALNISVTVFTGITLAPFGGIAVPGPYTKVTFAPAETSSDANSVPVFPVLMFVITRTGSIFSTVGPAVIRTFFPLSLFDCPNFFKTKSKTSSGSGAFAFPSIICGEIKSTLFFKNSMFLQTAAFSYMDACMARPISIGIFDPKATVSTVEIGVSSIPFASFPKVFAVEG